MRDVVEINMEIFRFAGYDLKHDHIQLNCYTVLSIHVQASITLIKVFLENR